MEMTIENEDPVTRAVHQTFGIPYLYPWQRLVIANILDAVSAWSRKNRGGAVEEDELFDEDGTHRGRQIVLLPTGAGKSLCFQAPALLLKGPTLVIYPLVALQSDQWRRLAAGGIEPVLLRGGQSPEERSTQLARMEGTDGKPPAKLIIANPEVLKNAALRERIKKVNVEHLAIDEAHCTAEWGDTFRPAYLELGDLVRFLDPPAVTAFTATASPPILSRVAEILFSGDAHLVRGETDRPNIRFEVNRCFIKEAALIREAKRRKRPMIVFCATRGGAERTAITLSNAFPDIDCRFYHAGLEREEKKVVEDWFPTAEDCILAATCAWGLGMDAPHVRTVLHRDPPPSAEAYLQEAGRAGRDGAQSEAVMLWSPLDRKRIELKPEGAERIRSMVLVELAEGGRCRRETLLAALGDSRSGDDAPGGEKIACSGCDICDGTARPEAGDLEVVRRFVTANAWRYRASEAVELLHERANMVSIDTIGFPVWRRSDFASMLDHLRRNGSIRVSDKRPWKGLLAGKKRNRKGDAKGLQGQTDA